MLPTEVKLRSPAGLEPRQSGFGPLRPLRASFRLPGSRARRSARGRRSGHAFSGPRSQATACRPPPSHRQHRVLAPPPGRPRMGPAIAGATTTLRLAWVAFLQACHGGALAGGSGMRTQDPFAVAQTMAWRCGVDVATARSARWPPASVGRRAQVPPPCCHHAGGRLPTTATSRVLEISATSRCVCCDCCFSGMDN